jgi:multiple sugar transport system ATP-binding protein
MARVEIQNLCKTFRGPGKRAVRAVDGLALSVEDGELLVLVGPSGCGKTTTLRLLAGLESADQGSISIAGQAVNHVPAKDRDIAMVFQNQALYPHLSVYDNMAFGLKVRKHPRPEIDKYVREAAEMLGLTACLGARPSELSGGQRQRVAVGRAIVRRPRLFLLDEPLSHLDPQMRQQMRVEISRLHARLGATMIYVTHDQIEAMTLGNRVAVMNEGRIRQAAPPLEIYRRPVDRFVAGFIGSPPMNFFLGTLIDQAGELCFQADSNPQPPGCPPLVLRLPAPATSRLRGLAGRQLVLGIRPENITNASNLPSAAPGCAVEALTELIQPAGHETFVHFLSGTLPFVARFSGSDSLAPGMKLFLAFDMSAAHFFDPSTERALL